MGPQGVGPPGRGPGLGLSAQGWGGTGAAHMRVAVGEGLESAARQRDFSDGHTWASGSQFGPNPCQVGQASGNAHAHCAPHRTELWAPTQVDTYP